MAVDFLPPYRPVCRLDCAETIGVHISSTGSFPPGLGSSCFLPVSCHVSSCLLEPTAAVHKHDTRQSKQFYVKKANTTHRLLSITVRGIHVWNGLASNITQLPSLQQFKKSLKSTLLSSYL